ncbi:MAG: DMT family transporter [bacterium]|nr:DMT family transporter [bacterium]
MRAWLPFAFISPVLWAASNLVDEDLVRYDVRDPVVLTAITGLFSAIPVVILAALGAFVWPGWSVFALAVATGIVGLLVYIPYLRALVLASSASVILMWNLTPVIIAGAAWMLLGERLLSREYLAIGLLVSSSLLAAYRPGPDGHHWSRAAPWMVLASCMYAAEAVLGKAVYERVPFAVGLAWISATSLFLAVGMLVVRARSLSVLARAFRGRTGLVVVANEGIELAAIVARDRAVSAGPVSLVNAIGGLQPIFVVAFAAAATALHLGHHRLQRPTRAELPRILLATAIAVLALALIRSFE